MRWEPELNQNPSSSACSHGSCQARVKHAPGQYQACMLIHARHSELSRNDPQLLTPFSHMEDPELDSENTPSRSDTPSIRSYLLNIKNKFIVSGTPCIGIVATIYFSSESFASCETANLSKPTASMNRNITSILPRTWQDTNRSLGPRHHLQLVTVYKQAYFGVTPLWSQPSSFHWMKVMTKLHCLMYFNLWNISKGESFSSCTRHEATGDISLRLCMPQYK